MAAPVLIDGFDLYNGIIVNTGLQAKWTSYGANGSTHITIQTGRFGGQCLRLQANSAPTGVLFQSLPASYTAFGIGFALKVASIGIAHATLVNNMFVSLADSAGVSQVGLAVQADGTINAYRLTGPNAGTLLGSSSPNVIISDTWQFVEWSGTIDDTTGTVVVKVGGVTVINLSSQDTRNGTPTTVGRIYFTQPISSSGSALNMFHYDDLYIIGSATTNGERRVETLYPTSDVAQGFARSTGSTNYTLVDEAQANGDTDYVQGSAVSDVDTYGFQDLTGLPANIDAIQVASFAEKTDATARSFAMQVKSGATTSDGSNYSLAASYGKFERILLTDPNTAAAWTAANVNAVQGGPKVTV